MGTGTGAGAGVRYDKPWHAPASSRASEKCIARELERTAPPVAHDVSCTCSGSGRSKIVIATPGALTVNDAGTLQSVCEAGYGIAQMFALPEDPLLAGKRLVTLFPEWSDERFPLYAYHPSRHHVPAKTRAMLEFVASLVAR